MAGQSPPCLNPNWLFEVARQQNDLFGGANVWDCCGRMACLGLGLGDALTSPDLPKSLAGSG